MESAPLPTALTNVLRSRADMTGDSARESLAPTHAASTAPPDGVGNPRRRRRPSQKSLEAAAAANVRISDAIPYSMFDFIKVDIPERKVGRRNSRAAGRDCGWDPPDAGRGNARRRARAGRRFALSSDVDARDHDRTKGFNVLNDVSAHVSEMHVDGDGTSMMDLEESHTALPRLKLWDDSAKAEMDDAVQLPQLLSLLRRNLKVVPYIGQDREQFLEHMGGSLMPRSEVALWRRELSEYSLNRKVMVYDPRNDAVISYANSPCLRNLADFLSTANRNLPQRLERRLYAAQYTLDEGLCEDYQPQLYESIQRVSNSGRAFDSSNEKLIQPPKGTNSHSQAVIVQPPLVLSGGQTETGPSDSLTRDATQCEIGSRNEGVEQSYYNDHLVAAKQMSTENAAKPRRVSYMENPLALKKVKQHLHNETFHDIFGLNEDGDESSEDSPLRPLHSEQRTAPSSAVLKLNDIPVGEVSEDDHLHHIVDSCSMYESPPKRKFTLVSCSDEVDSDSDTSLQDKLENIFKSNPCGNESEQVSLGMRHAKSNVALAAASAATSTKARQQRQVGKHSQTKHLPTCQVEGKSATLHKVPTKSKKKTVDLIPSAKKLKSNDSAENAKSQNGRNAITPKGYPLQPTSGPSFSTHVYLWYIKECRRSSQLVSIQDALRLCKIKDVAVYDGQDYDFNNGMSGAHMFQYDKSKWANRDACYSQYGLKSKVRVWSESLGALRCHHYSPLLRNLPGWLANNRDFCVFQPSLLVPSCEDRPQRGSHDNSEKLKQNGTASVRNFICNHLLPMIKSYRMYNNLSPGLQKVSFWHKKKASVETRGPFNSTTELLTFLCKNPAIELHTAQEKLLEFEKKGGFQLIPILGECPAEVASFWDCGKRMKVIRPKDAYFCDKTISQCLSGRQDLELYLGQDTVYHKTVLNAVTKELKLGRFPYYYMLVFYGKALQDFLSANDWIVTLLDTSTCFTAAAIFWDQKRKERIMQPDMTSFTSIDVYLEKHSNAMDLYVGQDMPDDLKGDLDELCNALSFRPGCSSKHRPVITKRWFLPMVRHKKQAREIVTGSIAREHRLSLHTQTCTKPENAAAEATSNRHVPSQTGSLSRLRSMTSTRKRIRTPNSSDYTQPHALQTQNESGAISKTEVAAKERSTEVSQGTTNCSEEDLDGSSDGNSLTPAAEQAQNLSREELSNDAYLQDGRLSLVEGLAASLQNRVANRLSKAAGVWSKRAKLIAEAGPKILNKQLVQDLRQALREALILEVQSVEQLETLAIRCRSNDFLKAANELCSRLERVDVYVCFTNILDEECGPPDLHAIREELESGAIFSVDGVARKFRVICADLIQYYTGSVTQNEAIMIKHYGELIIGSFQEEYKILVDEEKKLSRVSGICEQAQKIGFRRSVQIGKQHSLSSARSQGKAKPAIRVSGYQSDVTYLNYRDEKGYSIMGKRHSARVFGLSIAFRACEERIGNVQDCHVCRRKIYKSDGDALYCSNRLLGQCTEAVCRNCLQTVFNVDEPEFIWFREADNWACVHCCGYCPSGGDCNKQVHPRPDKAGQIPFIDVFIEWPYGLRNAKAINLQFSRRNLAGDFEPWEKARTVQMAATSNECVWEMSTRLPVGFYHCRVECDGNWFASTVIVVTPSCRGKVSEELTERGSNSHHQQEQEPSNLKMVTENNHFKIGWNLSAAYDDGPVHRYCTMEGGEAIQNCSRTEGYDWRRSKRHSVVRWVPKGSSDNNANTQSKKDSLRFFSSCDASYACESSEHSIFPKLEPGMRYEAFRNAVHAFRFDKMVSTLSGIVAGKSEIHGIGLFTLTGYRKGDFVIEYAGELIRTPLSDIREKRYEAAGLGTYFFKIDEYQIVDATVRSNRARFTNHSCDPNMRAQIVHVRGRDLVVLIATRDVPPFSELTFNYQLPYEDDKLQCLCNAWNCIGVMN